jgi:hypothetical protein
MDFFWLGLSGGFEQHAASLRNGLRMQAQSRPARARRRHMSPRSGNRSQPLCDIPSWMDGWKNIVGRFLLNQQDRRSMANGFFISFDA